MDVNEASGSCFRKGEFGTIACPVEEQFEKKQRRWTDLPATGSPNSQSHFLSFSHFLSSLPKIPSIQQTRMWVKKCDFSLGLGELGAVSLTSPSPLEKDRPRHAQQEDSDEERGQDFNDQTQPLLKGIERSHSAFVRRKNSLLSSSVLESESFTANEIASQTKLFEDKDPASILTLPHQYDCLQVPTNNSCLFSNHEEMSETTSRGKSSEMNSSSSCSAGSSNCFSLDLHVASVEFVCFWNTCSHKEKNTDRLFHHILHSHLHRSTDFRSTRCLWRGCSRDGILKVFNSRHKLLVHVGIHCQKLKEPQVLAEAKDQIPCAPQTEQTQKNNSLSNSMQNLLGLRRLFMSRRSGHFSRWTKQ